MAVGQHRNGRNGLIGQHLLTTVEDPQVQHDPLGLVPKVVLTVLKMLLAWIQIAQQLLTTADAVLEPAVHQMPATMQKNDPELRITNGVV